MNKPKFEWLDKLTTYLENVNGYLDKSISNLSSLAEDELDIAIQQITYGASIGIEEVRKKIIIGLHGIYESCNIVKTMLEPLVNIVLGDLTSVIKAVKQIIKLLTGPYYTAVETMAELIPRVTKLANSMQNIANYQPESPNVNISLDSFKLKVGTITMGEVISGIPTPIDIKKPTPIDIKKPNSNKGGNPFATD